MIYGIGTDIVAIPRIAKALARRGDDFARFVLADIEFKQYLAVSDKARFVAKRFCVKEAFSKACGTGIRSPLAFDRIWVEHDELGKPSLGLSDEVKRWLDERAGKWSTHLSLSDEKETVVAFVVVELY